METIGYRLKKLRKSYNFTQKELAEYLEFDQSYIAKLENNKRPLQVDTLEELCELYNCSEEYILEGKGKYDKINFSFRSKVNHPNLETIAGMNRIIKNLTYLSKINKR